MGTIEKIDVPDYLRGENQNETDQNISLYEAAAEGDLEKLRRSLSNGANPNFFYQRKEHTGVLHAASRNVSMDAARCAKELIERGAIVTAPLITNRNTPIHEAASSGSKEVCRILIESSPQCTANENSFGNTALHAASRTGYPEIVQLLLQNSADPNKMNHRGSTALHIACFLASNGTNNVGCVDPYVKIAAILLCDPTLDTDIQDVNGYTPLHIAAQRGCDELVKLLVDSGASLTAKTGIDSKGRGGRTPEGMAKFGGHEATAAIIKHLAEAIERGEHVATRTKAPALVG